MKSKIFKSFIDTITDSKFESDESTHGTMSFISWRRLKPYIEHGVNKKPNEEIIGIEVDETGIKVRFKYSKK